MSAPLSSATPRARDRELDLVARKWAYLVSMASYIPLPHKEIERQLRDMAHEVFAVVATDPLDIDRAAAIGERLVGLHCVGRTSLRSSIDVLAGALAADERLRRTGGLGERIARTLGALASGYADAVRWHTVEHQDGLNQALLEAVRKSERSLRDREAECDEVVGELSLLRSQLNHQLLHDVLTALPNRQFFTTRLEHVLNTGSPTSVYHVQINGLTTIRGGLDGRTHTRLLRLVADRLTGVVATAPAMVARFEEGRFGILLESERPAPDPAPIVEAINTALAEPANVGGLTVIMSASTGVVQSPPYSHDPVAVLHAAGLALGRAKRMGPGRWTLLEPDGDRGDREELRLAATLPDAWWSGRLHVGFRPQVSLADGRPVRLDASLRWDHPELGLLTHQRCVALAERTGFGERLGRWLLERAGVRLRSWPGELPLTVALAPSQATDPDLLSTVYRSGVPVERLQVSVPAGVATSAAPNLTRLADAGIAVAVHDFGGSAGDVTCLSDVPVHAVRLAPELVRRSAERITGRALRDMVALVHEAGAIAVVDDMLTETQADWWRDAGADLATGPLFTLPANVELPQDI
jgi:predicted signal transduction protein with EAL and GGDEF domain